jgi:hypothetical protein
MSSPRSENSSTGLQPYRPRAWRPRARRPLKRPSDWQRRCGEKTKAAAAIGRRGFAYGRTSKQRAALGEQRRQSCARLGQWLRPRPIAS